MLNFQCSLLKTAKNRGQVYAEAGVSLSPWPSLPANRQVGIYRVIQVMSTVSLVRWLLVCVVGERKHQPRRSAFGEHLQWRRPCAVARAA